MTVQSDAFREVYTGNGSLDEYDYTWKIYDKTQLLVTEVLIADGTETVYVVDVDYTVTGINQDDGGSIILTAGNLPNTKKIVITPNFPFQQDVDLTNQASVPPERAEEMGDKLSGQIKQIKEKLDRAVVVPVGSTVAPTEYLTTAEGYKNDAEQARDDILNNAGFIVVSGDLLGADTIGTVAGIAANVTTVAGISADVTTVAGISADVTTLAAIAADITATAAVDTEIATLGALGTEIANLGAVASDIPNAAAVTTAYPLLVGIGGLTPTDGNIIVGNGTTWVAESGATARASLGLAINTNVQAYDAATAKTDVAQEYTATQNFNMTSLTDAATVAWDLSANQVAQLILGGNRTLGAPTNQVAGATYILIVKQPASPNTYTLGYHATYLFPGGGAPVIATGANAITVLSFVSDGTNMLGVGQEDFS